MSQSVLREDRFPIISVRITVNAHNYYQAMVISTQSSELLTRLQANEHLVKRRIAMVTAKVRVIGFAA